MGAERQAHVAMDISTLVSNGYVMHGSCGMNNQA